MFSYIRPMLLLQRCVPKHKTELTSEMTLGKLFSLSVSPVPICALPSLDYNILLL